MGLLRRVLGLGDAQMASDRWLNELARRESRIEFHGSGKRWRFDRRECDNGWLNRWRLSQETQEQERRRA